jgi:hydrogenase/urease accessory protein HupE
VTRSARRQRWWWLSLLVLLAAARSARAHDPFEITTDAHVTGAELDVHMTLSLLTATRACFDGGERRDSLAPGDFELMRPRFEACARDYYRITSGGEELPLRSVRLDLGPEGDLEMRLAFARPSRSPLVFDALRLRRLVPRAGVVLTVTGVRTFLGQKLLRPDDALFELPITAEAEAPGTPELPSLGRYLQLGVEHILTGADHLLFLIGLLVMCRRLRTVGILVTCFTLAHSLTLALAALDWVELSAYIVEPLIAASIAFVGLENLLRGPEPDGPWIARRLLAFAFGLVHGLGFASALRELGLGKYGTSVVAPLIAFNVGVELGQLAVAAVLVAILRNLPRTGRIGQLPRLASLVILAAGVIGFVHRIGV